MSAACAKCVLFLDDIGRFGRTHLGMRGEARPSAFLEALPGIALSAVNYIELV